MAIGASIFSIALGAVLAFAVDVSTSGIDLNTIGVILMVVGVIGLAVSMLILNGGTGGLVRRRPPAHRGRRLRRPQGYVDRPAVVAPAAGWSAAATSSEPGACDSRPGAPIRGRMGCSHEGRNAMKLGVVGKGGVGKTSLSGLLCQAYVARGKKVLAVDTDSNPEPGHEPGAGREDGQRGAPRPPQAGRRPG